jgi:hypothetical protein
MAMSELPPRSDIKQLNLRTVGEPLVQLTG